MFPKVRVQIPLESTVFFLTLAVLKKIVKFSLLLEPHKYQLRAYVYQARNLIPSDASGLSGLQLYFLKLVNNSYKTHKENLFVCVIKG